MSGESILIVDDNAVNLKLARVLLTGEGFAVRTAQDADDALALVRKHHPDLILMDIQLPGMDGLELTRRLKADPATRSIVIIAMTAYAMKGDDERALAAGCDGYVSKPIDTRELSRLIERHLGSAPERTVPVAAPVVTAVPPALGAAQRMELLARDRGERFAWELLELFDGCVAECVPAVQQAIARGDGPALAWSAHKLGGSCRNLGAEVPARLCSELETQGNAGSFTGAAALTARLEPELARLQAELRTALGRPGLAGRGGAAS